ncbi:PH domain-containing protein [Shewanella sp. SP2S2-4]|uniref:PH domain-containing protein n=1 Tax=Shewanella vaxholmensis TaxID=3063535 RepID=A0ABU9UV89_9GAMM|nr:MULTISPECIES: PH domain-containing protein [unclassified Shewanella]MDT3272152.1 PH domain-containing protein [Shewanella sp. SP2S2-4]MDT3307630.1 PH domain-containing protein [Shewanella sp. SP1S1-4]
MEDKIIHQAEFESNLGLYWLLSGAAYFSLSIVGIPLLLLWFPIGLWGTRRYIRNMSAELTSNKLIVRRGILTRTENSVPLDKITDMALIQGPIMRLFGLHKLTVETAGQSGAGALISLVGIVDAPQFRTSVLEQKERLTQRPHSASPSVQPDDALLQNVVEMAASLKRIEALLSQKLNR